MVLFDVCVLELVLLVVFLFCLLLGIKFFVFDVDELLIFLVLDVRFELLEGLLIVFVVDVIVLEVVVVEVVRLLFDVDVGGVDVVVVDNFLFLFFNCFCCFRVKE